MSAPKITDSGWAWGSIGMAAWAALVSLWQRSYTNGSGREVGCGSALDPAFPMDGRGPCTDIINDARLSMAIIAVISIGCGVKAVIDLSARTARWAARSAQ